LKKETFVESSFEKDFLCISKALSNVSLECYILTLLFVLISQLF